jgi:selenoprotein W-related protein
MKKPIITIEYCPKCNWLMRAAYMAQEILTTFADEVGAVLLQPSEVSGKYTISSDDLTIFDRKKAGGFHEIKEIKQLIRDVIAPDKKLGHSDRITQK